MKPFHPSLAGRALHLSATAVLFACVSSLAGEISPAPATPESADSWLSTWWNGKSMSGRWFGARDALEDRGLTVYGKYYGAFFGVVDSEKGSRGFWDQGIEFGGEMNFGKLLDVDDLTSVKGFASFRWRDPSPDADPNRFVDGASLFSPTNWISGTQFRVLSFGMEIGSGKHLPVDDMIVVRGGWLQPQREFIDQPDSKLFLNNAVNSAKGIGGDIPFSSSFSTWGGTLRVKPVEWSYVKAGWFLAYPKATSSSNHGLAFEGFAPNPGANGMLFFGEAGITPKIGPAKLPGRYAFGGYYFGNQVNSFNGSYNWGLYGFYWQFDQMLFREPSGEAIVRGKSSSDGKTMADGGKSFKEPVATDMPQLSKQGLRMFNLINYSPEYNNLYPFYFQSGLVYEGLIPQRDQDLTMLSIACSNYSTLKIDSLQVAGNPNQPNYTLFLEGGYRIQINQWAFFQPFIQYSIKPAGTGDVSNATILGFYTGLTF